MNTSKRVIVYATSEGKEPFTDWLNRLQDAMVRKRILVRVSRLQKGNYGDYKIIGEGIKEARMFFGSGYRVYFGERGNDLIILLCGGDKSSQNKDIEKAKKYWQEYLNE